MKIVAKVETQLVDTVLPLFGFDISTRTLELDAARRAIAELQISHPDRLTSNVHGEWMSPKNSHLLNENLQPICKLVTDICGQVWSDIYSDGTGDFRDEFYVWQCWTISYGNGGYAASHNHFPAFFSAVIYLDTDEESAPIVFGRADARAAIKNAMYLFPGSMQHHVPLNTGKRTVVALNILKKNPA